MSKQTLSTSAEHERKINVDNPNTRNIKSDDFQNNFDTLMVSFNQEYEQLLKFFREAGKVTRNHGGEDPFHVIITSLSPDQKPDMNTLEALAAHLHVHENDRHPPMIVRQTMPTSEAKFLIYGRKSAHHPWVLTPLILNERDKDLFNSLPTEQPTLIKTSELKFKVEKALRRHIENLHAIPVTHEVVDLLEEIQKRFCEETKIFATLKRLKEFARSRDSIKILAEVQKKLFALYEEAGAHVGGTEEGDFYEPLLDYMDENYAPLEKILKAQQYIEYTSTILISYRENPQEWRKSVKNYALNGLRRQRDLIHYIRRPPLSCRERSILFQPVTYPRPPLDSQLLPVLHSRLCIINQLIGTYSGLFKLLGRLGGVEAEVYDAHYVLLNLSKWESTEISKEHYIKTLKEFTDNLGQSVQTYIGDLELKPVNLRNVEAILNYFNQKELLAVLGEDDDSIERSIKCTALCKKFLKQYREENFVSSLLSDSASSSGNTDAFPTSALQQSGLYAETSRPEGNRKRKKPNTEEVEPSSKFERH